MARKPTARPLTAYTDTEKKAIFVATTTYTLMELYTAGWRLAESIDDLHEGQVVVADVSSRMRPCVVTKIGRKNAVMLATTPTAKEDATKYGHDIHFTKPSRGATEIYIPVPFDAHNTQINRLEAVEVLDPVFHRPLGTFGIVLSYGPKVIGSPKCWVQLDMVTGDPINGWVSTGKPPVIMAAARVARVIRPTN